MKLLVQADARRIPLADQSVHCVVTSPPYWGLRCYGTDKQIGLEKTPDEFVAELVGVFREVRRVLRDDGTLWLNLGDSYASDVKGSGGGWANDPNNYAHKAQKYGARRCEHGLKPKDLVGIPWRVAFALQADGWVLRSDVVWSKPNPMPESVTDRPTKAHEMLFLFSKAKWIGPPRGRFADISDEEARWLALLIDAEGSIVVKRSSIAGRCDVFAPQIAIANTSRPLMERVAAIVGHGNIHERAGKNAPVYYWQIAHNLARDLLYRCYPFFIVKQRQARIGIHVDSLTYRRGGKRPERKARTEKENAVLVSLWERNKACNQFGDPDLSDVPEPKYGRWDSQPYFYDCEAVREAGTEESVKRLQRADLRKKQGYEDAHFGNPPIRARSRKDEDFRDDRETGSTDGRARGRSRREQTGDRTNGRLFVDGEGHGPSGDSENNRHRVRRAPLVGRDRESHEGFSERWQGGASRNRRTVWTVATQPYSGAHFATFPPKLIEPCILAGTSERGVCPECGGPWERVVERSGGTIGKSWHDHSNDEVDGNSRIDHGSLATAGEQLYSVTTTGWRPSCSCGHETTVPATVLDPFGGTATTVKVANEHGRRGIALDLSAEYLGLAAARNAATQVRFA